MSATWSKLTPLGTSSIRQGDDEIRAAKDALEEGLGREHRIATGELSSATYFLRHTFGIGNDAARAAAITIPENGNIWLNSGLVSGNLVVEIYQGGVWRQTSYSLLLRTNVWTKAQSAQLITLVPSGGIITPNFALGNYFYYSLPADTSLANPSNMPAAGAFVLFIENSGGWALTFSGTYYEYPYGTSAPTISSADDRLGLEVRSSTRVWVSHVPGWS